MITITILQLLYAIGFGMALSEAIRAGIDVIVK